MVRLAMNVGRDHKIHPGDVLGVILGAAHLTKEAVGTITLLPKITMVDIAGAHAGHVLKKLNGIRFKGHVLEICPAD
jgi:ATP-dependent RNA helicase DeaD